MADEDTERPTLELNTNGDYELSINVGLSLPGSKAAVKDLFNEDKQLANSEQLKRYIKFSSPSSLLEINKPENRQLAKIVLDKLDPDFKINVEAFEHLILAAGEGGNTDALTRLVITLCDVTGKDVKKIIARVHSPYTYTSVEEDWSLAKMVTTSSQPRGEKPGPSLIIVPGSPIIGLLEDKFNQSVLAPTGIVNYDVRSKSGLNFLIASGNSTLFGMQVKGTHVAAMINDSLDNVVRNFGQPIPAPFIQAFKRLPLISEISDREQVPGWVAQGLNAYKELLVTKTENRVFDDESKEIFVTYLVISQSLASRLNNVDPDAPLGYLQMLGAGAPPEKVSLKECLSKGGSQFAEKQKALRNEFLSASDAKEIMAMRKEKIAQTKKRMEERQAEIEKKTGIKPDPTTSFSGRNNMVKTSGKSIRFSRNN